jgi:hypothetical protein
MGYNVKIFDDDRVTINQLYTFRKSEIQGIISFQKTPIDSSTPHMYLNIIISGNKFVVDEKIMNNDTYSFGGIERQLEAYHRKWEEALGEYKQEKVIIK